MNLKEQIANANDIKIQKVHVKAWDCDIYLKQWSPREQCEYHDWCDKEKETRKELASARVNCKLLITCVCDESGNKVFSDEDFDMLMSKNVSVVDYIAMKILKMHELKHDDFEERAKN